MFAVKNEWRKLSAKDSARIRCQGNCADSAQATWCRTMEWYSGNRPGVSFLYNCDSCKAKSIALEKAREEERKIAAAKYEQKQRETIRITEKERQLLADLSEVIDSLESYDFDRDTTRVLKRGSWLVSKLSCRKASTAGNSGR